MLVHFDVVILSQHRMNTSEHEPYRHEAHRRKWKGKGTEFNRYKVVYDACLCSPRVCFWKVMAMCVCVCVFFQVENIQTKDKLKVLYIDHVLQRLFSRHTQINNNWLMMITPWTWLLWVVSFFLHTQTHTSLLWFRLHLPAITQVLFKLTHCAFSCPFHIIFVASLKKSDVLNCTKDTLLYISSHTKKKHPDMSCDLFFSAFFSLFLYWIFNTQSIYEPLISKWLNGVSLYVLLFTLLILMFSMLCNDFFHHLHSPDTLLVLM